MSFVTFTFLAVLHVSDVANAGFNEIWFDGMDDDSVWNVSSYSYLDWSNETQWMTQYYSYDPAYSADRCVTDTCAMQWSGYYTDEWMIRTTQLVEEFETVRLNFDLVLASMETGNGCEVSYRLDDGLGWVVLAAYLSQNTDFSEKYYGQSLDIPTTGASSLDIRLYADGTDWAEEFDVCFWDNLQLSGQRPVTSEPSLASAAPSVMPTGSPTNSSGMPTVVTASPTMAAPQTTMFASTVVAGDDDSSHDHDHDDDMGSVSRFSTKIGPFFGVMLCVLQLIL